MDLEAVKHARELVSRRAEAAVLGSVLLDNRALNRIAIAPEDFSTSEHREIFLAMSALSKSGKAIDTVTLYGQLNDTGKLEAAGGLANLGKIYRETPTAEHVDAYVAAMREGSTHRGIVTFCESLLGSLGSRTPAELVDTAQHELLKLVGRSRTKRGLVSSKQLAGELVDDLDRRREAQLGLNLGLPDFDRLTCGLEGGDLVVIAARPGMGKTAFMVSIADNASEQVITAVFSAEMPALQLMRRHIARRSGISQGRLRRPDSLNNDDWASLSRAAAEIASRKLLIDESAMPTLAHVRAEAMACKARSGLGLVLVDYCQLVRGEGSNRYEQLLDVAYGFKGLAKDLEIPVVLLAQLNRGVESRDQKRPHLSDLRDSGAIEEAADIVGLLYSEGYYDKEFSMPYVLECAVEKNRNGERGQCLWEFDGATSRVRLLPDGPRAQYLRIQSEARQPRKVANL